MFSDDSKWHVEEHIPNANDQWRLSNFRNCPLGCSSSWIKIRDFSERIKSRNSNPWKIPAPVRGFHQPETQEARLNCRFTSLCNSWTIVRFASPCKLNKPLSTHEVSGKETFPERQRREPPYRYFLRIPTNEIRKWAFRRRETLPGCRSGQKARKTVHASEFFNWNWFT